MYVPLATVLLLAPVTLLSWVKVTVLSDLKTRVTVFGITVLLVVVELPLLVDTSVEEVQTQGAPVGVSGAGVEPPPFLLQLAKLLTAKAASSK